MVTDDDEVDIPFTQEEIRQQEAFERRQKRNDSERAEPLLVRKSHFASVDTTKCPMHDKCGKLLPNTDMCDCAFQTLGSDDDDGCPHCGSYEGDYNSCPECGHGQ